MSATRSRRSGAGESGSLNAATIPLLPTARLKSELEARGLDTKGNRDELAIRLQDHVKLAGAFVVNSFDPSPRVLEGSDGTPQKKSRKRKIGVEPDENIEFMHEEPVELKPAPIRFTWASKAPVEFGQVKPIKTEKQQQEELVLSSNEEEEDEVVMREAIKAPPAKKLKEEPRPKSLTPKKIQLEVKESVPENNVTVGTVDDILRKRKELKREKKRQEREQREKQEAEQQKEAAKAVEKQKEAAKSVQLIEDKIPKRTEKKTSKREEEDQKKTEKQKEEIQKKAEDKPAKQEGHKQSTEKSTKQEGRSTEKSAKEQPSSGDRIKKVEKEKPTMAPIPSTTHKSDKPSKPKITMEASKIHKTSITTTTGTISSKMSSTSTQLPLKPHKITSSGPQKPFSSTTAVPKTPSIGTIKQKSSTTSIGSSLDILDSIMDSQQQLLSRKQRHAEEEEEEEAEKGELGGQKRLDLLNRQQRMTISGTSPASISSSTAPKQQRRMSSSALLGVPPPPPPKAKPSIYSSLAEEGPTSSQTQPIISYSESEHSMPMMIIDSRDPLGLSLVGPDTPVILPPLPPPPPPPKKPEQLQSRNYGKKDGEDEAKKGEKEEMTNHGQTVEATPHMEEDKDNEHQKAVEGGGKAAEFPRPSVSPSLAEDRQLPLIGPVTLATLPPPPPPLPPPPPPPKKPEQQQLEPYEKENGEANEAEEEEKKADEAEKEKANEEMAKQEQLEASSQMMEEEEEVAEGSGKAAQFPSPSVSPSLAEEGELSLADSYMPMTLPHLLPPPPPPPPPPKKPEQLESKIHDEEGEEEEKDEAEEEEEDDEADEEDEEDEADEEEEGEVSEQDEEMASHDQTLEISSQVEDEDEDEEASEGNEKEGEFRHLLRDPKTLLQKAQDVLRRKFGDSDADISISSAHYEQVGINVEEFKKEVDDEDIRQLPDPDQFHGEPVPDDMDDDLFELAAGLPPRNKKKEQEPKPVEDEPLPDAEHVELDFYNSDLNMKASTSNKWLVEPDNGDGFALMWGGVRANWGVLIPADESQRAEMPPIAFQVKITEFLSLKHLPFEEVDPHQIRVGWSQADTSNMLGESQNSYAFSSMGNKAMCNVFSDFSDPFYIGDVITSVLDVGRAEIRYYKNGQSLGAAFTEMQLQTNDVYFPHLATKNCKMMVNFGSEAPEPVEAARDENGMGLWSMPADEVPEETEWIGNMDRRMMAPSRRPIADKAHCTIIAMVGLPGVGKTTWVRQYLKEHPDENWILLNTDTVLQAMSVNGVPRQRVHQGRWDMVMGLTAKALNRSLQMACRRRHNYILDQTNVWREARKRKLTQFQDFQRKCVVIIPNEAEHERRLIRQAREAGSGGQMPAEAMLEMKGQFSIPCTESECVEDVIFVEPPIERINEAIEQVKRYNQEGQPWVRNFGHQRTKGPESLISDHSGLPPPRFLGVTRIGV